MLKKSYIFFIFYTWGLCTLHAVEPLLILLDEMEEDFTCHAAFKEHELSLTSELLQALALPDNPLIITSKHLLHNIMLAEHIYEQTITFNNWDFAIFYDQLKHITCFSDANDAFIYFTYFQHINTYKEYVEKNQSQNSSITAPAILHHNHHHYDAISFYCAASTIDTILKNFVIYTVNESLYIIIPKTNAQLIKKLDYLAQASYDKSALLSQKTHRSQAAAQHLINFIATDFAAELTKKMVFLCGHGASYSPNKKGSIAEFTHDTFSTFTQHLGACECLIVDSCYTGGINQKYITISPQSCPIITIGGVENSSTATCECCTINYYVKNKNLHFTLTNRARWQNLKNILQQSYTKTNDYFLQAAQSIWYYEKNTTLNPEHFYTIWHPHKAYFTPLISKNIYLIPLDCRKHNLIFKKRCMPEFIILEPLFIKQKMIFQDRKLPGILTFETTFFDVYREIYYIEALQNSFQSIIESFFAITGHHKSKRLFYIHTIDDHGSSKKEVILALNMDNNHTCYILYFYLETNSYYLIEWQHPHNKRYYQPPTVPNNTTYLCSKDIFNLKKQTLLNYFKEQQSHIQILQNAQSTKKRPFEEERVRPA